jgi:hypothetical protein
LGAIKTALPNGLVITRDGVVDALSQALATTVALVGGDAGTGKSAVARQTLARIGAEGSRVIAFTAEDLNVPSLVAGLQQVGFIGGPEALQAYLQSEQQVILFVDGAEKLAEFASHAAFDELVAVVAKNPNWRMLVTTRSQSVEVFLTTLLADVPTHLVTVEKLSEPELSDVLQQLPALEALANGSAALKEVLRLPFYLALATRPAVSARTTGVVTADEVRQLLWRQAVENPNQSAGGMPLKRRETLISLCAQRARALASFIIPTSDLDAVQRLLADGILLEDSVGRVAPAHDIFDDWALRLFAERQVNVAARDWPQLLDALGTSPGMRRALRAWMVVFVCACFMD